MNPVVTERHRAQLPAFAAAMALAAAAVVADPETTHVPLCPLHAATGLYCPLCGGLRAVHALSRGALGTALHDNVLVVAAIVIAPLMTLSFRVTRRSDAVSRRLLVAVVAVAVVFAIVRNLPMAATFRPA